MNKVFVVFTVVLLSIFIGCHHGEETIKYWDDKSIPGTNYTISFSTRYYESKLLYILEIGPYDNNTGRLANTVSVDLVDINGFTLETLEPSQWIRSVDEKGDPQNMSATGNIPITRVNYREIYSWSPKWSKRDY
jgi:hypothetical protein